MSNYLGDLLERVLFTAIAAGAGLLLADGVGWSAWWALPAAAVLTGLRSAAADVGVTGNLAAAFSERVGWTVLQTAVGALATSLTTLAPTYGAVIAAGVALLKGLIAKRIGDPETAATLPAQP